MTTTMTTTTAKTMTTATMTMMTTTSLAMNSYDDYDKNDNKKSSTLTTTTAQWTLSPKHLQPDASKKILLGENGGDAVAFFALLPNHYLPLIGLIQ